MAKRKRKGAASIGEGTQQDSIAEQCPYRVEYQNFEQTPKTAAAFAKKRLRRGRKSLPTYIQLPKEELDYLEGPEGPSSLSFRVLPIDGWARMKQYKNFIVNGSHHTLGDFVQVRAGNTEESGRSIFDDGTHWIARVLEIRATGPMHVFLRVIWMYWPRELPWGPQYYHGMNELIASNHMEIIAAATVSEGAKVEHLQEFPEGTGTIEGLFWRQKYDYANQNALAELQLFCVCDRFHHADKLLIHCENPKCGLWLHEDCLIKATLENLMTDSLMAAEDSEETKVEEDQLQKELHEAIEVAAMSRSSQRRPPTSKRKVTKQQTQAVGDSTRHPGYTLDDKLHGELEIRLDAKGDDNITGRLFVVDLEDDQSVPKTYPMHCLGCSKRL